MVYKPFFSNLTLCNFYLLRFAKFIKLFYWNSLYFTSFFIFNCNFCVFNHTFSRLAAGERKAPVFIYEKIQQVLLLLVQLDYVESFVQAYYAEVFFGKIRDRPFAFRYFLNAIFKFFP